ncbi:uncharacterized protein LOC110670990 [Hevea brasiliensis]|uniref:uncharacterized protein LOC110670990 n=1 Tax=Hevea brasiliensis TaxID=3981 RepID=UPI0025F98AC2|nr:uncharacterized protein LOC110670990 [Hevea brasiliensis]
MWCYLSTVCNMKRKGGNKKGKQKGPSVAATNEAAVNLVSLDGEDNSAADDDDDHNNNNNNDNNNNNNNHSHNNEEYESGMDIDTPSSTGTDQPLNLASIKPDGSIDKTAGKSVGCVKVKLKTSKLLELQSDTDKGSPQLALEKQGGVSDKIEDTGNSLSEIKTGVPGNVSTKPGSIKIKSSKVLGGLSVQKSGSTVMVHDESLQQKEPETPHQESQYNKQELDSALLVIKKVMKMDAAEPFNVPVNPEALGIPDYFDIIDEPMDFGTICRNLEKDDKYMNSEDVYKDVQFIWDNCYKQNRCGTHRRRHKLDCLCAICVLKRCRRECEENARLAKGQIGGADNKLAQELKQEKVQEVKEKHEEDDNDEEEEKENEMEIQKKGKVETSEQSVFADRSGEKPNQQSQPVLAENAGAVGQMHIEKGHAIGHHEEETQKVQQNKNKLQESQERQQKAIMFEKFHSENPLLLSLCRTLFSDNHKSVCSGPHSLVQHEGSGHSLVQHVGSGHTSSIHAAIETLMK